MIQSIVQTLKSAPPPPPPSSPLPSRSRKRRQIACVHVRRGDIHRSADSHAHKHTMYSGVYVSSMCTCGEATLSASARGMSTRRVRKGGRPAAAASGDGSAATSPQGGAASRTRPPSHTTSACSRRRRAAAAAACGCAPTTPRSPSTRRSRSPRFCAGRPSALSASPLSTTLAPRRTACRRCPPPSSARYSSSFSHLLTPSHTFSHLLLTPSHTFSGARRHPQLAARPARVRFGERTLLDTSLTLP